MIYNYTKTTMFELKTKERFMMSSLTNWKQKYQLRYMGTVYEYRVPYALTVETLTIPVLVMISRHTAHTFRTTGGKSFSRVCTPEEKAKELT